MANKKTVALTVEQYENFIEAMQNGSSFFRPNEQIMTSLVLEANLGLRIEDILNLTLDSFIKDGDRYRLDIIEIKTKKKREFTVLNEVYEYIKDYFNNKKTKVLDNLEKVDYYEDSFSTITVDLPKDLRNILTLKFVYLYDFYDISRILKISFDEVVEKYNLAIKYLRDDKKVLVYKRG